MKKLDGLNVRKVEQALQLSAPAQQNQPLLKSSEKYAEEAAEAGLTYKAGMPLAMVNTSKNLKTN